MRYETMWSFKTRNFRIEWAIKPCDHLDLSWDESGETREKLSNGQYEAFDSRVRVLHLSTGITLGSDYLHESIYATPADFRTEHVGARGRWGSYFPDMVKQAITEARDNIKTLQAAL